MDCMAMDSPHLGPLSQSLSPPFGHSHNMFDSAGLPSINLDAPPSPGLSDSQAVLGELAYEARGWAAAADGEGVTMDVGAFARSFELESNAFTSPGIPRLETVQRRASYASGDDEDGDSESAGPTSPGGSRQRKRPRLLSLGALAETDMLGLLNSAYDSMAASFATSLATAVLPNHMTGSGDHDSDDGASTTSANRRRSGSAADSDGQDSGDGAEDSEHRIGAYTVEERRARIARFHRKRKQRVWNHKVKYDCRKKLADNRPRFKGRFVRRVDRDAAAAKAKKDATSSADAAATGSSPATASSGQGATGKASGSKDTAGAAAASNEASVGAHPSSSAATRTSAGGSTPPSQASPQPSPPPRSRLVSDQDLQIQPPPSPAKALASVAASSDGDAPSTSNSARVLAPPAPVSMTK